MVPTRDRPEHLRTCLAALRRIEAPPGGFEVIVVDDGGSSRPPPDHPGECFDFRWFQLDANQGPAAARNLGAIHARGRFLAFIDDDCVPSRQWLSSLFRVLSENPRVAAGGAIWNGQPENLFSHVNQLILDAVYRYYNHDPANAAFFAGMNLAVPAQEFRALGGFDPGFRTAEDREFCARWRKRGLGMRFVPEAVVVHQSVAGFKSFWRRHYAFGSGAWMFRHRYTLDPAGHVKLEPVSFYRCLLLESFTAGSGFREWRAFGLAAVSQVASALGYWAQSRSSSGGERPELEALNTAAADRAVGVGTVAAEAELGRIVANHPPDL